MSCFCCKWFQQPDGIEDEDVLEFTAPCLNPKSKFFNEYVDIDTHCEFFEDIFECD